MYIKGQSTLALGVSTPNDVDHEGSLTADFNSFIREYGRAYGDAEKLQRFEIYKHNADEKWTS